jgi:hypothetical protein
MKRVTLAVLLSQMTTGAYAASCKVKAAEMKLAGAAMCSFMKRCEADAMKTYMRVSSRTYQPRRYQCDVL